MESPRPDCVTTLWPSPSRCSRAALRRSGNPSNLTRVQRLRLFVLLGSLTAFGPLSIDMYLPALPAIARDLAASESVVQLTHRLPHRLALGQIVAAAQ